MLLVRQWNDIFKVMKASNCQHRIALLVEIPVKNKGRKKFFDKYKLKEFNSRHMETNSKGYSSGRREMVLMSAWIYMKG